MIPPSRRRLLFFLLAVLAVLVAIGWWYFGGGVTDPNALTVAYDYTPLVAPFYVAEETGCWKEEGARVTTKEFVAGRLCLEAVLSQNADVGTVAATPLVNAAWRGAKFSLLCRFTIANGHQRCVARRDRGIDKPSDLKGKRVASSLGTSSESYLDAFLKAHGLRRDQLEVINLKQPEMANALVTGSIDAALGLWEPYTSNVQDLLGPGAVVFPPGDFYTTSFYLVCRPDFVDRHPELAAKAIRGLVHATQFMAKDRARSIEIVAGKLKIDRQLLDRIWDEYQFDVRLDQAVLDELRKEADLVRRRDPSLANSPVPDFRRFLDPRPLREVLPKAVSLP